MICHFIKTDYDLSYEYSFLLIMRHCATRLATIAASKSITVG